MFETFEHKADVGVRGKGNTIESAFEECAKAMISVMVDINSIEPKKSHVIKIKSTDESTLLINFLNELLFLKDKKKMIYSKFRVNIEENMNEDDLKEFNLKATCFGEKIDLKKHEFLVDVKAATYSQLKVKQENKTFVAQCIVDV
ncbi:MAG: archease [Candidatus Iainarchaeum sp.]|nr:MAG: hypothetical protein BWY55_00729 [archaeon ADurb.Bin336]